jgi:hypothetical protein
MANLYAQTAGLGNTGIGDNFARTRLLLAKRAGYLPQNHQVPGAQQPGAATAQFHQLMKGLVTKAASTPYAGRPMQMMHIMKAVGRPNTQTAPPVGQPVFRQNPFTIGNPFAAVMPPQSAIWTGGGFPQPKPPTGPTTPLPSRLPLLPRVPGIGRNIAM